MKYLDKQSFKIVGVYFSTMKWKLMENIATVTPYSRDGIISYYISHIEIKLKIKMEKVRCAHD